MGDIADMMLDGTLCESCGVYIGDPVGYPRYCEVCQKPGYGNDFPRKCEHCGKKLKNWQSMRDHNLAKHTHE